MIDFRIRNGKIEIDPYTLTIQAFHNIWEFDKSDKKTKASNMLLYVFHLKDITQKNPFRNLPERDKEITARHNAFGSKDYKFSAMEQELIDEALVWYDITNKNCVERLGLAINRKIDQVTDFLMDPKNDIVDAGMLQSQIAMLANLPKLFASKQIADKTIREETEKKKVKGNTERSPLQKGIV